MCKHIPGQDRAYKKAPTIVEAFLFISKRMMVPEAGLEPARLFSEGF